MSDTTRNNESGPLLSRGGVRLRRVLANDYPALHEIETVGDVAWRWRQRGRTLPPEEFVRSMWSGVFAQFIIEQGSSPLGLAIAYDLDLTNGVARFGLLRLDTSERSPQFLIGAGLFLDYLYYWWPIRKLYAEVTATNMAQFASGEDLGVFEVEGELKSYAYRAGAYESVFILSVDRDSWSNLTDVFARLGD